MESATADALPTVTKQQILNCSYRHWYPRYKHITPRSRLIRLPEAFLDYLRADGIILPPDHLGTEESLEQGSTNAGSRGRSQRPSNYETEGPSVFDSPEQSADSSRTSSPSAASANENDDSSTASDDEDEDPSTAWRETHLAIQRCIRELGGRVLPKLNWSAPKDATWINATNSMDCYSANDVYLLLKSSDFVTHDLEHAFYGCKDAAQTDAGPGIYHLTLRKHFPTLTPSTEFRCFVASRQLVAITPRSLRYYSFLPPLKEQLTTLLEAFFEQYLRDSFEDSNFVFDVWVPRGFDRVWLIDINPWAVRTDPLLFSWLELVELARVAKNRIVKRNDSQVDQAGDTVEDSDPPEDVVRVYLRSSEKLSGSNSEAVSLSSLLEQLSAEDAEDEGPLPLFRIVLQEDVEAKNFSAMQPYSAHKLPREVVDAGSAGPEAMADFARELRLVMEEAERQGRESNSEG